MRIRPSRALLALGATVSLLGGWRVVATLRDPIGPTPPSGFEALRAQAAYRTSRTCQPCHADHVASWGRTFHRTMTRDASPEAIVAPFDGRAIDAMGVRAVFRREGDAFFLDAPDPGSNRMVSHRIDRVTGSRRMQQFETREGDRYVRLPVAWSIDERRFMHLSEAFFHADGEDFHAYRAVWDLNCIFCHTTHPVPGLDRNERLSSKAAELGIACEACHGPGEEHARRMRQPLRRYAIRLTHSADPTIVNPARLEKSRSVEVCGHCHGQRLPADRSRIRDILGHGDAFTPGEDLRKSFEPVTRETKLGTYSFASRFWSDGSPRLTAYEYQGVLDSPCYRRGTMTCLSCHTMHAGDPHGQMRAELPGNAICTQCHGQYAGARVAAHSRHPAESSGSRCVGCHMPPVVYGVLTWHPTHRIASPDPAATEPGTPDACTVCHTGRSRAWAASSVARLWPRPTDRARSATAAAGGDPPELPRALFSGDAVYRALAASRLGVGSPDPELVTRVVPLLAELLIDPYPNVRRLAREALVRLTGRSDLPQAQESPASRDAARAQLEAAAPRPEPMAGWPFTADGALDRPRLSEWIHARTESEVSVGE
jgi:predicted CXXCH cytochrome family protein